MLVILRLLPYELAPQIVRMSLWLTGYAIHVLLPFALCAYALTFSPRLRHRALARPTIIVQWGLLILGLASLALSVLPLYHPPNVPTGSSPFSALGFATLSVHGLHVLIGVFGLLLLNRYRRTLNDARRKALAWAAEPEDNSIKTP